MACAALMLTGVGLALVACSELGPRVYTAHPYRAEQTCVAASIPIGVVQAGDLDSNCAPVCLFLGETLYVSGVCAPYPPRAALLAPDESSDCALALSLLETETLCKAGPTQPSDAGLRDGDAAATAR